MGIWLLVADEGPPGPAAPTLVVTATDEHGAPLAGAVVRVFRVDPSGLVFLAREATTPATGTLELSEPPEGPLWVVGYARDRSRASASVSAIGQARQAVLTFRPAETLSVHVGTELGAPVPNAQIRVVSSDPLPHTMTTDADGRGEVPRLSGGPYAVEVSADGYETVQRAGIYIEEEPLEVRLEALGGLAITVLDDDGLPAPEAEVLITGPSLWPPRVATTDVEGRVDIEGLYAGVYDLKARKEDRVSKTMLSVPVAQTVVREETLELGPGAMVTVTVGDGPFTPGEIEPRPVFGAHVVLVEDGVSAFPSDCVTNEKGICVAGPFAESVLSVSARADGFAPGFGSVDRIAGEDKISIGLLKTARIAGRIRDERGYPVLGARLEVLGVDLYGMPVHLRAERSAFSDDLFAAALAGPTPLIPKGELGVMPGEVPPIPRASRDPSVGDGPEWITGMDGAFELSGLPAGSLQLLVVHPEYTETLSDVLSIKPGSETEVDLVLKLGGTIEGRVFEEDGFGVDSARILAVDPQGTYRQITYTEPDGSFTLVSVPSEINLSVTRAEDPSEIAARLEVTAPKSETKKLHIVLSKPRLGSTFRILNERRFPISGVELRVQSLDLQTSFARTLFGGEDGVVVVPSVRGLPLRVVAERPGRAPLAVEIDAALDFHELTMGPGLTLTGYVSGRGGRVKLEGADVTLFGETGSRHGETDEDGLFTATDLPPGRLRLVTRMEGYADDERAFDLEGDGLRPVEISPIDLTLAGTIEGQILDDTERPIARARVARDRVPTFLPLGRLPKGIVETDASGRFLLPDLPEGSVTLEVYHPEWGRARSDEITVYAERTTRKVILTMSPQDYEPPKLSGTGSLAVTLALQGSEVVVLDVPEGGEAEFAGLLPGDVLESVQGRRVRSLGEARELFGGPLELDMILGLRREMPGGEIRSMRLRSRREAVRR